VTMDRFSESNAILKRFTGDHQARASASAFPVVFQPGFGRASFSSENRFFSGFRRIPLPTREGILRRKSLFPRGN